MCTHNLCAEKLIPLPVLGDHFCGQARGKRKRNVMQALRVSKLEAVSRTVTFSPRQHLSDEQHRPNVQQCMESEKQDSTNAIKTSKGL